MSRETKSTISISIITIISRVTGLLRVTALSAALGQTISVIADSYNLANTMPNMVYELVMGGILTSVFIPVFVEYKTQKSEKDAWDVANRILSLALAVLCLMTILCWIFTPQLVYLQTMLGQEKSQKLVKLAIDPEFIKKANFFFYFFAPQIIFYGMYAIFGAMLNTYHKFIVPAMVSILNNILVIATIIAYYKQYIGLTGLAIGTTAGIALMAFAQVPSLYKLGWKFQFKLNFKDPVVKRFFNLATPMLIYVALNQVALLIRNNFATSCGQGMYTAMTNGFTFFQLPYGIFSVSIMTVLYPALSKHAVDKDMSSFRQNISQGIRWSAFIIIPCAVGLLLLSDPIIRIALQHGYFHANDTGITAQVLSCYSLALLPYTLTLLFTRAFYAMQDLKTPVVIVLVGVILTAIGCYILVKPYGVPGVALAYGAQYIGMAILFWILLRRKIQRFEGRRIVSSMSKSVLASLVMGLGIYYYYHTYYYSVLTQLRHGMKFLFADTLSLSLAVAIGTILYFAVTWMVNAEEFYAMKNWVQRRKIEL